jgi:SPP1 family predicted phage head-tail adaptor
LQSRDAAGGSVVEWVEAGTVWASKQPVSGGRMYAAEAKHFEASLVYRIRARPDVAPGWRLVHGDDFFEIVDIQEQGRDHYFDLSLRGIDQTSGGALSVVLLHGSALNLRLLHDGTPVLLHNAA